MRKQRELFSEKLFYECTNVDYFEKYVQRDADIRYFFKQILRLFKNKENEHRKETERRNCSVVSRPWSAGKSLGVLTNQDAMSKVDLAFFSVEASMNLTRYRYDVFAHFEDVAEEAIVLSHEQRAEKRKVGRH